MTLPRATPHTFQSWALAVALIGSSSSIAIAETPLARPTEQRSSDARLGPPRTLDDYFPFTTNSSLEEWASRSQRLLQQVELASGLWPPPSKTPLGSIIYGRVERDDYFVEKVIFESLPGHYVTGNLYRPKNTPLGRKLPGVLCPHGHWPGGRFNDTGNDQARLDLSIGAERWENAARHPLQARCVQLARMGCIVFHYDMLGYADSVQISVHQPNFPYERAQPEFRSDQFFSANADARLQTFFGLQTWNSVRSVDFLLSLPEVDPARIAVTGASGGGTQSMILAAIDDRVAAAFPCVMVSTSMQGGCPCENAPYLRIGMGNIDIAALMAPRPLGLTAANDWTRELRTKGYPDLRRIYTMFGHPECLTATFNTHFEHNYNHVTRCTMYGFINRHFGLGFAEPVLERDFVPLSIDEMSVWNCVHPKPTGDAVGPAHEKAVRDWLTTDMEERLAEIISPSHADLKELRNVVGGAWDIMIGRNLPDASAVDFKLIDQKDRGLYFQNAGLVRNKSAGEEIRTLFLYPKDWNGDVVLWVAPEGKSSLLDPKNHPHAQVQRLLDAKYAVVSADLFGQAKSSDDGIPISENRMVVMYGGKEAWQHYSAYTYGYNPPLFIQRVHDLLTLVSLIRHHELQHGRLSVVGHAGTGPWVAAARAQVGDAIDRAAIDTAGFRFSDIDQPQHADFVPGAVKYGDLPVLLALSAPHSLWIFGENKSGMKLVEAAYRSVGESRKLSLATAKSNQFSESAVDWILSSSQ